MLSSEPLSIGQIRGTIYRAAQAGEMLPRHIHDASTNHISFVGSGKWEARGDWGDPVIMIPGPLYDWNVGEAHEIEALEPGTLFNILKGE